ncbi:pyruvate kinase [Thiomonas sp.]|uniref:pyruvate kinase n=1 Tax=Thiomonas sp. TaxID=2047785 RepID=UPI0026384C4A|nr:pyruvate kinase [Thiomonas sp.]
MSSLSDASALREAIARLRDAALAFEQAHAARIATLSAPRQVSARNLLHYIAVRQTDLRPLQLQLAQLGLSSLGSLETHVVAALDAVLDRLDDLLGQPHPPRAAPACSFTQGAQLLQHNTAALLGPARAGRDVRIMVTLDTAAADDPGAVAGLVDAGMDLARINCAHDDPAVWQRMAAQVRAACSARQWPARVQIDLAGPKSRTGALQSQGRVLHLRPQRDVRGRTVEPARLALWFGSGSPPAAAGAQAVLPARQVAPALPARLPPSTSLQLTDARGRQRQARLLAHDGALLLFAFDRAAYLEQDQPFSLHADGALLCRGVLDGIPAVPGVLRLQVGDPLLLTREPCPGQAGVRDAQGRFTQPPQVQCTLDAAFTAAQPGQAVWLDDGRIGAVIERCSTEALHLRITHAAPQGSPLRAEKGINFPDTVFRTPALTDKDVADLQAMAAHTDLVALSFLRSVHDVAALRRQLAALGRGDAGIVLKIENRQAFASLPAILLDALAHPAVGVMIARGDLAVELGFERLAEVQEEILWLCEAAHLPVIWATQMLDTLAHSGLPSRPEVTDAAMSIRAECAMLNKGPHIVEATRFLSGVLGRMEGHYAKRMALRRPLSIAGLDVPAAAQNPPASAESDAA